MVKCCIGWLVCHHLISNKFIVETKLKLRNTSGVNASTYETGPNGIFTGAQDTKYLFEYGSLINFAFLRNFVMHLMETLHTFAAVPNTKTIKSTESQPISKTKNICTISRVSCNFRTR